MEFEEFAAARTPALLRYAYMLCGDRELARDLTQEVLIRTLVKWRRISRVEHPDAYLRAMLTNEYLSVRRRKVVATVAVPYDGIPEGLGAQAASPERAYAERAAMMQRLGTLPRRQRAVIVLRYYEDLSDAQIADILGCRASTVRAYATRALAALRVDMTSTRSALSTQSGGAA